MKKYSQEQLKEAFNKVSNKKNWKNRINSTISSKENLDLIAEAIIHFTGSCPLFINKPNGKIRVTAAGYYLTIGA
jgi:hypothetical protein